MTIPDCEDFMTPDPPILTVPDLTAEQWDVARVTISHGLVGTVPWDRSETLATRLLGPRPKPSAPKWALAHDGSQNQRRADVWVGEHYEGFDRPIGVVADAFVTADEAREMAAALIAAAEFVGGGS